MTTGRINQVARKRRCERGVGGVRDATQTTNERSSDVSCDATRRGVERKQRHEDAQPNPHTRTTRRKGLTDSAFCCEPSREAWTSKHESTCRECRLDTSARTLRKAAAIDTCSRWSQAPGYAHTERAGVRQEEKPPTRRENTARDHKTAHRTAVQPSHGRPRSAAGRGHRREGNAKHVVEEAGRCRRTRQSSRDDPRGAGVPHLWSTRGRCERRALQACTLATLPTGKPSSPLAAHKDACDAAQAAAREPAEGA
jgi:hypothetical protein